MHTKSIINSGAVNKFLASYLQLTKPKIMILILAAGLTSLIVEGSLMTNPAKFAVFLLALYLTGGCANALNQCFEINIDSRMTRTCNRRPLPTGKLKFNHALIFSILIGAAGIILLVIFFNILTALLALGTILFYSLLYTVRLKPRSEQNIVIGGLAGAMAPVGAWTAATGTMALTPWLLFLIIFFWTPPHFWSLAIKYKEDYKAAGLPMMPVVRGDRATLNYIFFYGIVLFFISLLPLLIHFGWIYLMTSIIIGIIFLYKICAAKRKQYLDSIWGLFKYSILYLLALFSALIADKLIKLYVLN